MSEVASRQDIDEVIDILKSFMTDVSSQFSEVNKRFDILEALILPVVGHFGQERSSI